MKNIAKQIAALFLIVCAGTGLYFLQSSFLSAEKNTPSYDSPSLSVLSFFGFSSLSADISWIELSQMLQENELEDVSNIAQKTEEILQNDPHFLSAYTVSNLILPLSEKGIVLSSDILQKKGLVHNRHNVDILSNFAFHTFYYQNKTLEGKELFLTCKNKFPKDCPEISKYIAEYLTNSQNKYEMGLQYWLQMKMQQSKESPQWEKEIVEKRIEEAAKLTALSCAVRNYEIDFRQIPNNMSDLLFRAVDPCPAFFHLPPKVVIELSEKYDFTEVTEETLRSPFPENPFEWDKSERRVKTKWW